MTERTDGGYAFPQYACVGEVELAEGGLSIRDWFAGQAIGPLLQMSKSILTAGGKNPERILAIAAYKIADAMISERDRK